MENTSFVMRLKTDKKMQMWAAAIVVVLLSVILGGIFYKGSNDSSGEKNQERSIEELDSRSTSRLIDGVDVSDASLANIFPTAIMIENLVQVRPQSGLGKANVVYEVLAEGGITRFMAIYAHDGFIEQVGPVRSARDYYVELAEEYGAVYAHAGGSPEALAKLQTSKNIIDANALSGGAQQFFLRDPKKYAPHNLFTNSGLISELLKNKGVKDKEGNYAPWKFTHKNSNEEVASTFEGKEATSVRIDFSSKDYAVSYEYDAKEMLFKRLNGGEPHLDALTDKQISVKTVIVQKTDVDASGDDKGRVDVRTTGEGDAVIFTEGRAIEGSWKYNTTENRTRFYDITGNEIVFMPGNIWVEIVPEDKAVEFTAQTAQ